MTSYLDIEDVLAIRDRIADENPDSDSFDIMTHHGLLSALAAPRQSAFGSDAFPNLGDKAAALLYHLIQNHPFWDGNKRIASEALRLFLLRNGLSFEASESELEAFTVQVASGNAKYEQIVAWICERIGDPDSSQDIGC
jgi:death-on-curing protein